MARNSITSKKAAASAAQDRVSALKKSRTRKLAQPATTINVTQAARKAPTKGRKSTPRKVAVAGRVSGTGAASRSAARAPGSSRVSAVASAVAAVLNDASADEVEQVLTIARGNAEELDSSLWGAAPGHAQATAASVLNLREQFSRRHAVERESVTRAEAAKLLGTSDQAVTDALEARRIVGFKRGRQWVIPAWQFDADTEQGVVPGLERLTAAFPGGVVALSGWAMRPSPDLGGASPRALLVSGGIDRVVASARALTSAGW
jgi:hypothetical protein